MTYDQDIFDPSTDHKQTSSADKKIMFASVKFSEDRKSLIYRTFTGNEDLEFIYKGIHP